MFVVQAIRVFGGLVLGERAVLIPVALDQVDAPPLTRDDAQELVTEVWEIVDRNYLDARRTGFSRAKFRRLRLGNPKIKAVVAAPGAADLLALVGFVPEQGSFGGYFNERWLVLPEGDDGSRAHDAASLIWSVLLPQGGAPAPAAPAKDPLDRFWQVFLPSEGVMRIELPDSFFQRSPLEIKLEYQKRKVDSATNGKLLTKALRAKYAKTKKPVEPPEKSERHHQRWSSRASWKYTRATVMKLVTMNSMMKAMKRMPKSV